MRREQLEEYTRIGRSVISSMYLRKSRAEEHMSLEETLAKHKAALTEYAARYGITSQSEKNLRSSAQNMRLVQGTAGHL